MKEWQKINFCVPITESLKSESGDFLIRGIAINATTTRNRTRFEAAELQASAPSLRNKPLLKDHNNSIDSIVGRTTENVQFDQQLQAVTFEARVVDEAIQKKINAGLVQNVSIGAHLTQDPEVVKDEDGNVEAIVARGIDFLELSLVAVPADPGAGFAKALMESFDLKRKEEGIDILQKATTTAASLTTPIYITTSSSSNLQAMLKCSECGKNFSTQAALDTHMADAHEADDGDGDEQKLTPSMEAAMADENKTLEALKAEREQLEIAVETLKLEKLNAEKLALQKVEATKEDLTKGTVTTSHNEYDAYSVEGTLSRMSISRDLTQMKGTVFDISKPARLF